MLAIPMNEASSPSITMKIGSSIVADLSPRAATVEPTWAVAAMAIVAIIDPTYDSKMSAPIPAVSPTLSPTRSAMTAEISRSRIDPRSLSTPDLAQSILMSWRRSTMIDQQMRQVDEDPTTQKMEETLGKSTPVESPGTAQLELFTGLERQVAQRLREARLESMSPEAARDLLRELRKLL